MKETIRSDQISCSVVSDSLRPHESQHTRPPCPSPTPRVHWDSRPSSHWCHPAISSSVVPFSSCPQSLPASESFPMSQLFAKGLIFPVSDPRARVPNIWLKSLTPRKKPQAFDIPGSDLITSPPILPDFIWIFLYDFGHKRDFILGFS